MQFLKTLFWVVIAVFLAVLATRNWHDVTLSLWGDIQADIKLPVLLALMFLIGFLPPFLILLALTLFFSVLGPLAASLALRGAED